MNDFFTLSRKSSKYIAALSTDQKSKVLHTMADLMAGHKELIKAENQKDLSKMDKSDPKYDRLLLSDTRIDALASSLRKVALLPDPVAQILLEKELPNGLLLQKTSVPLGVVGIIYESRPNVTVDVASLCLMSGNAAILKGGKEADDSNKCLVSLIHQALSEHDLPAAAVTLLPADRSYTEALLKAEKYVDVIIPRGSDSLIQYVRQNSSIPTIETGAGVCHTYIEKTGNLQMGADIIINAKVTRPSVCNSLDTALADKEIIASLIPKLTAGLAEYQVQVYADEHSYPIFEQHEYPYLHHARREDYSKEWLGFSMNFVTVEHFEQALEHIEQYSSRHSEAIITEDQSLADQFINQVDAAAVYHNASTRFTDGEEFGLGAEIGISTQKLHARGPFALEKLVTEKWIVKGNGQIRV